MRGSLLTPEKNRAKEATVRDWTKIKPGDDLWLTREQVVELHARVAELEARERKLLSLLGEVHPAHPQPEICEACHELKR